MGVENLEGWVNALTAAQKRLAPGLALDLQRKLALLTLGAAYRTRDGGIARSSGASPG